MTTRTIKVDYLARVEGEGALYVRIKNGQILDVKFKIFEPPRFFEAFLRGRSYLEAPDITARICGICPIAYQMSAVHAMEDALGITIPGPIRELRRLIYCGEWIESHALHVFLLHAPDFLGYPDAIHMAKDHPKLVQQGLDLKKLGNEIISLLAGRAIHPINVRVGGFYRVPTQQELAPLRDRLKRGSELCSQIVRWTRTLPIREYSHDYEFVALRHLSEYPMNEGRIVSNRGLDITAHEFDANFKEEQVAHSNALHSIVKGRGAYLTGPLARYNLNFDPAFSTWRARLGWRQNASIRLRASSSVRWRCSTPSKKPSGSSKLTSHPRLRPYRASRGSRRDAPAQKHPEELSIIGIPSTLEVLSATPKSCRPLHRIKRRLRMISVNTWRNASGCRRSSSGRNASK
jgi:coenzyme F420-reducing hydrogenase alpha subunit